jgi:HK97 gp10 family phage protein
MREFGSLAAFASHLVTLQATVALEAHKGLKEVAEAITKTAKGEIGSYQQAIGPFPAWAQLAGATVADRVAKGYTPDDPLLRDGKMRDSISNGVSGHEAVIGSDSNIAVYQELGTDKIPPRPFLGPAVIHNHEAIKRILGAALARGILGGGPIPASLGYDESI